MGRQLSLKPQPENWRMIRLSVPVYDCIWCIIFEHMYYLSVCASCLCNVTSSSSLFMEGAGAQVYTLN
jgi:hypothetical protein